jgi:hypothetical protein
MSPKVALIVIFNHRYDGNLEKLDRLYGPRFSSIRYLMPFYDGPRSDVIPVYENSYYYQGYIAQAVDRLQSEGFSHYVFIGDDVLLNPALNEKNLCSLLGLDGATAFTDDFRPLHVGGHWPRKREALEFFVTARGSEGAKYLPTNQEIERRLMRYGYEPARLIDHAHAWQPPNFSIPVPPPKAGGGGKWLAYLKLRAKATFFCALEWFKYRRKRGEKHALPFPLIGGFSDFFVLPTASLKQFSRYCGIFASMKLFVEIAIPTALAIAVDAVRTVGQTAYRSGYMWSKDESDALESVHQKNLNHLLSHFPNDVLFYHPVKLSRWSFEK